MDTDICDTSYDIDDIYLLNCLPSTCIFITSQCSYFADKETEFQENYADTEEKP